MNNKIKFAHTNIIAKDWKKLAQFYIDVFNCEPIYPERDLAGEWLDELTKVSNAAIKGVHLKLPGYDNGPTLEIFEYNTYPERDNEISINDLGFGHIAFHVDDVEDVLQKLTAKGGKKYGELIEKEVSGVGILKAIYVQDIEGNIIEIQNWKKYKS